MRQNRFRLYYAFLFLMQACASTHLAPSHSDTPKTEITGVNAINPLFSARSQALSSYDNYPSRFFAVTGTKGMVVADDGIAANWGSQILRQGGNAVDAAVATAFTMAVTRPQYASLGGGGFILVCLAKTQQCHSLDFREMAPRQATADMYIRHGKVEEKLSEDGALASGTPGVPMGLLTALQKWGSRPRAQLLKQPINLALRGTEISSNTENCARQRWDAMNPSSRKIWGCQEKVCPPGQLILQQDLAKVLMEISQHGTDGFYKGWVAQKITKGIQEAGGILTMEDFAQYRAAERTPIVASFKNHKIFTMPPPSSGGALLKQLLLYSERAEDELLKNKESLPAPLSAAFIHSVAQRLSLSFADRADYFGDPDFVQIPIDKILSASYIQERWRIFDPSHYHHPEIFQSREIVNGKEPRNTTHLSVVDREGNAASMTLTVNDNFGSAFTPPGTGVVMNNQMNDFSLKPGVPNMYGLVGGTSNAIAAKKRPLSSMTPTIVKDAQGKVRFVIGASGGPRIITSVFYSLLLRLQYGWPLVDAVAAPRIHHQWTPPILFAERNAFAPEVISPLQNTYGYRIEEVPAMAHIHAIEVTPEGRTLGVPDLRGEGMAVRE